MPSKQVNNRNGQVDARISIEGVKFDSITAKEVILGESLHTPGLQTAVTLQSQIYGIEKNFDEFKNKRLNISLNRQVDNYLDSFTNFMSVSQVVYRLDNREFMPINVGQTEEFTIHACDQTLLNDAKSLVSKSWKCTRPSEIVDYVLGNCVGAKDPDIESCDPARDYIAENIHPFQVIAQQCNVALNGDDPSFVHYMTFGDKMGGEGVHHFKSIKELCNGQVKKTFFHDETGALTNTDYNDNRTSAFVFNFPCDFDLLSDLLNGVDEKGQNINSLAVNNLLDGTFNLFGNQTGVLGGCGIGGGNYKASLTNKGTSQQQNSCDMNVEKYLLKRQARMSLLERDKVALRITTPWSPELHVGDIIRLEWYDKPINRSGSNSLRYGSGNYLISSLMHKIQFGGHAVTTLDCVAQTAGQGIV